MKHTKGKLIPRDYIGVTSDSVKINKLRPIYYQNICSEKFPGGTIIAKCLSGDKDELQANVKRIVKCWNTHIENHAFTLNSFNVKRLIKKIKSFKEDRKNQLTSGWDFREEVYLIAESELDKIEQVNVELLEALNELRKATQ